MITIKGVVVHEQYDNVQIIHTCKTRRAAQVLLPGERLGALLDARVGVFCSVSGLPLPPRVFVEQGDTQTARQLVEWHLGVLAS